MELLTKMTLDKLKELRSCSQRAKALEAEATELRQRQQRLEGDLGSLMRTLDIAGDEIPPEERKAVAEARMALSEPVPTQEYPASKPEPRGEEGSGHASGVSLAIKALNQLGCPTDTRTLLEKMIRDLGYKPQAANPYTSLFSSLRRTSQSPGSQIIKRHQQWGLREWGEELWAKAEQRSRRIDVEALNKL
jgi:hypothetical protein